MRWAHVTSVIVLVGSAYYVRRTRSAFDPAFRATVYLAIVVAFLSGLYNFMTKASYPPGYHMWFGIKFLLALHVFAALWMAVKRQASAKLEQSLRITLISATLIILISNYLRWISLSPVVKLP